MTEMGFRVASHCVEWFMFLFSRGIGKVRGFNTGISSAFTFHLHSGVLFLLVSHPGTVSGGHVSLGLVSLRLSHFVSFSCFSWRKVGLHSGEEVILRYVDWIGRQVLGRIWVILGSGPRISIQHQGAARSRRCHSSEKTALRRRCNGELRRNKIY